MGVHHGRADLRDQLVRQGWCVTRHNVFRWRHDQLRLRHRLLQRYLHSVPRGRATAVTTLSVREKEGRLTAPFLLHLSASTLVTEFIAEYSRSWYADASR